jgi:hypothetical protein
MDDSQLGNETIDRIADAVLKRLFREIPTILARVQHERFGPSIEVLGPDGSWVPSAAPEIE